VEDDRLREYEALGFAFGGKDIETVVLIGNKEGKYGITNLNSPSQTWGATDYPHESALGEALAACTHEVTEYIFNGKRSPAKQLDLDLNPELDQKDPEEPETPTPPKRKKKTAEA
jgi:hypothetical protein